ncbi:hypothetical protein D9M73_265720 [compost metagenome]
MEVYAVFGKRDLALQADLAQQVLHQRLADQVDAPVEQLEIAGQMAVALVDVAQQMLRLEVHQVQFAEQIEQR